MKCWLALSLLAAALVTSGCQLMAPSDDVYEIGVARIGDDIHVFAPTCDSERIARARAMIRSLDHSRPFAPALSAGKAFV